MNKLIVGLLLVAAVMLGAYTVVHQAAPSVGATPGPDQFSSPYYAWNGLKKYPYLSKMNQASTTLCSFKSPAATTTLRSFVVDFKTGTTTASTVYLAKATTPTATTTNFETASLAANALATVIASTTGRTANLPVIAPNTYLTVGQSGGTGTFSPNGRCALELEGVD